MTQYTLADFEPVEKPDVWQCPSCHEEEYESYESCARHHIHCDESGIHFLHDYFGHRLSAAYLSGKSTNELSDLLGPDSKTIRAALSSLGIETRDTSSATKTWFENLEESRREEIKYAGQEKAAEKLSQWRAENPEKHEKNAVENLPEPQSGIDNPCWKGGVSLRDALTRIYGEGSWQKQRARAKQSDDYTCSVCGEQARGEAMHTHHIVPVLAGGSNHPDNLMTVCRGCHRTVEDRTWEIPEVTAVFDLDDQ